MKFDGLRQVWARQRQREWVRVGERLPKCRVNCNSIVDKQNEMSKRQTCWTNSQRTLPQIAESPLGNAYAKCSCVCVCVNVCVCDTGIYFRLAESVKCHWHRPSVAMAMRSLEIPESSIRNACKHRKKEITELALRNSGECIICCADIPHTHTHSDTLTNNFQNYKNNLKEPT